MRHERSCCHNRGPWWEILILQRWEIRIPHIDGKYGRAGACLCLLCGSSSPLRKWEGLKSGLPLASTPPQSLKCEKASKTTWPMIKTSFGKARPPFHNEWIVPLINYNWSSFRVKREVPHQRQFLTRVIDLHWLIFCLWKALLQMREVEECRSVSWTPQFQTIVISVYFFAKHQRSHRATVPDVLTHLCLYSTIAHIFIHILVYVCVVCSYDIDSEDCVNINVFRQQLSSHHRPRWGSAHPT